MNYFQKNNSGDKRFQIFRPIAKCAVPSCPHRRDNPNWDFFPFPAKSTGVLDQWLDRCKVKRSADPSKLVICDKHFLATDFERNYTVTDALPKKLLSTSIPSLHLSGDLEKNALEVESILQTDVPEPVGKKPKGAEGPKDGRPSKESHTETMVRLLMQYKADPKAPLVLDEVVLKSLKEREVKRRARLRVALAERQKELDKWTEKMKSVDEEILKKKKQLKTAIGVRSAVRRKAARRQAKLGLNSIFSPAQVDYINRAKKVVWSHEDMAMAFTLRHMSNKECYLYLKKELNYPLPALSAVQRWAASVD